MIMLPPNARDVDIMARTVYGEARGESLQGMIAVGHVILNRARAAVATGRKQFGNGSIASACLADRQFSTWNEGDPNRLKCEHATLDAVDFQRAMYATLAVLLGEVTDPTAGALFYWADSIPTPAWAEGKVYLAIGHHRFIRDA